MRGTNTIKTIFKMRLSTGGSATLCPICQETQRGTRKIPRTLEADALKRATMVEPPAWVVKTTEEEMVVGTMARNRKPHSQIKGEESARQQHSNPHQGGYKEENEGFYEEMGPILQQAALDFVHGKRKALKHEYHENRRLRGDLRVEPAAACGGIGIDPCQCHGETEKKNKPIGVAEAEKPQHGRNVSHLDMPDLRDSPMLFQRAFCRDSNSLGEAFLVPVIPNSGKGKRGNREGL